MFQYFIFSLCTLLTPLNVLNCTPHQVYKLSSPNRCLLLPCGILRCLPISAHAHIPPPTIPTVNLFVYFSEETETLLNPPFLPEGKKVSGLGCMGPISQICIWVRGWPAMKVIPRTLILVRPLVSHCLWLRLVSAITAALVAEPAPTGPRHRGFHVRGPGNYPLTSWPVTA